MKYSALIISIFVSLAAAGLIDPTLEVVCPDSNVAHCYPKVFKPTDEWQTVREGQDIPPGLHVRLNMETGEREAKLVLEEDSDAQVPVLVEGAQVELEVPIEQKIQETLKKYKQEQTNFRKSKVSESELSDYASSVEELLHFGKNADVSRLEKALDTLIDLSHDIDFGERLTRDPKVFSSLLDAAQLTSSESQIPEKSFRIMGSSLRNNPAAVTNVFEKQDDNFMVTLFATLESPETLDVVRKRIAGVIHALASHMAFAYQFFNVEDASKSLGFLRLLRIFPKADHETQERIVLLFEDLKLLPSLPDKRDEDSPKPQERVSEMLQTLVPASQSEEQLQKMFKSLVELHRNHDLRPSKQFLQWLSKEAEMRKNTKNVRDKTDADFDTFMLEARHLVFGNPNALRKADEF